MGTNRFQAPAGTRDMYPKELLRRRYIEKLWRDTSIRHGFEEIDGPTFEHADLYAVKSGEGILAELFQVYSGKDAAEVEAIRSGKRAPYALRPEFTPTLARMYASKAASLPRPTRWFWMQNCYRAERQQRGRLREFGQWNCDIIGEATTSFPDADLVACVADSLALAGLAPGACQVRLNHRMEVARLLDAEGVSPERRPAVMGFIDELGKLKGDEAARRANELGLGESLVARLGVVTPASAVASAVEAGRAEEWGTLGVLAQTLAAEGNAPWCAIDRRIVRGLAYYTGMVFEVIAEGERAIAGGGRYDNLIELFGGPSTPAVGFGMGDVVLSLVLEDRGLMPDGEALLDALSAPSASYRPDAFVIAGGEAPGDQEGAALATRALAARLRRGTESAAWLERRAKASPGEPAKPWDADRYASASGGVPPLHARLSAKATKNVGKLIGEANAQRAKVAVIVESATEATVQDLRAGAGGKERVSLDRVAGAVAERARG